MYRIFTTMKIAAVILLLILNATSSAFKQQKLLKSPEKLLNILAFLPTEGRSHFNGFIPLLEKLVARGHNLTLLSPFELDDAKLSYRHIKIEKTMADVDMFEIAKYLKMIPTPTHLWWFGPHISELSLNKTSVKDFIEHDQSSFDLIMFENFYHECYAALGHKYGAHLVQLLPFAANSRVSQWQRNPFDPAYIPDLTATFGSNMSFIERTINSLNTFMYVVVDKIFYLPQQNELVSKYFVYPGHEDRPELIDILRNISLTLINSHPVIGVPAPQVGTYVNVAGMHCVPPKPLPEDLREIMDNAEHGVIYFSFGSILKSSYIPDDIQLFILSELSKLDQIVLWKWESHDIPLSLPKNVVVRKWFPQNDVLGHPKCKLFITHGGVHSTIESVYHGVPMLAVPVFGDQLGNSLRAQYRGIAIQVPFFGLTEEQFQDALNKLLNDDSYSKNSKMMSEIFRDNPLPPLDLAIYSIEYVERYGMLKHDFLSIMRNKSIMEKMDMVEWQVIQEHSNATHLYWFQYLLLDISVALFIILIGFFCFLKLWITYIGRPIFRRLKRE